MNGTTAQSALAMARTSRPPTERTRENPGWSIGILSGMAAPLIYAAAVAAAGLVSRDYSHLQNSISEIGLFTGAPGRLLEAAFILYDILLVAFALAGPTALPDGEPRMLRAGSIFLAAVGIAGLAMSSLFPTDIPGEPLTPTGVVHIVLAAVSSGGTMLAIVAYAMAFRSEPRWRAFAGFSLACLAVIFVSGLWTAVAATRLSPLLGLAERLTIGVFLLWVFVFSLRLWFARRPVADRRG